MKRNYLYGLICLSLVFLTSCQSDQALSDSELSAIQQQVLQTHRKTVQATETAGPKALFAYVLDNEGVIIQNGRFHKNRQDALSDTEQGFEGIEMIEYTFDHEVVEVLSPDKALLKASGTVTVQANNGREFRTPFSQTVVFTQTPDGWKILHAHHSTPAR